MTFWEHSSDPSEHMYIIKVSVNKILYLGHEYIKCFYINW